MWICVCGHTPDVVTSFIEIRSGVWEPLGVEICQFPLLWLLAFTTVQAVKRTKNKNPYNSEGTVWVDLID